MSDSPFPIVFSSDRHAHRIDVEAYSGGRAEEEPRAFTLAGVRREVRAIHRRWRTPEGRAFEVETDGGTFTLLCREPALDWVLVAGG